MTYKQHHARKYPAYRLRKDVRLYTSEPPMHGPVVGTKLVLIHDRACECGYHAGHAPDCPTVKPATSISFYGAQPVKSGTPAALVHDMMKSIEKLLWEDMAIHVAALALVPTGADREGWRKKVRGDSIGWAVGYVHMQSGLMVWGSGLPGDSLHWGDYNRFDVGPTLLDAQLAVEAAAK